MDQILVIPARLGSKRLKNKPLIILKGKTILERTYLQCTKAFDKKKIYVATDSHQIKMLCKKKKITYNGHHSSTVIYARKEIKINKRKKIFLKKFCLSKLFSELPNLGDIIKVDEPVCLLHLKSKDRILLNKRIEQKQSEFLRKIEEI